MSEIKVLTKHHHITIYEDPYMELGRVLFGRKGKDFDPGIKFMPYIPILKQDIEGSSMDKEEIEEELKEIKINFSDYTFAICNKEELDKTLQLIDKKMQENDEHI